MSVSQTWLADTVKHSADRNQRMYDFLKDTPVAVLSTVDPEGNPHGSVIYYTIDKEFKFSFITKIETKKYDNLIHNNHVMLTVFEPLTQTTVQLTGKATEIEDGFQINAIAVSTLGASMKTSDSGIPPLSKLEAGEVVGFEVSPVAVRMAVYARPDPGDFDALFESIEPQAS